jgi:DUF1680 family protein
LQEQLRLAATGLTGRLMDIWEDVGRESGWLGGGGESWERGPYYVRGLVALAHTLGERELIERASPWIEWTLASQRDDGFFGPASNDDWWPRMPMLDALRLHGEASGDARVLPFMRRYFRHQLDTLPNRALADWAVPRGGDNVDAVLWLYARTGDPFLLDLADLLRQQTSDWIAELGSGAPTSEAFAFAHGVNRAMGLKAPAVFFQRSRNAAHLATVRQGWERTLAQHGQIQGTYSSDEFLHGLGSTQGAELCVIVELLASLGRVLAIGGDPWAADAFERLAYNAWPAILTADLCGHQYFQLPNQVGCTPGPHRFQINHGNDLLFGPMTGYGCCAANLHLGWPLIANHLWLTSADGGLAAPLFAPSIVETTVAGGTHITVVEETSYPFDEEVHLTFRCAQPARFPLALRVPPWATAFTLAVNGTAVDADAASAGSFVTLARTWRDGDHVELRLPMAVRLSRWERGSVGIERGPLVYALRMGEDWRPVAGTPPFADYEVHPTSAWNFGLRLAATAVDHGIRVQHATRATQPWSQDGAGIRLRVTGARLPEWTLVDGDCGPIPEHAVATSAPAEELTLIPFGCARLRVSMFPAIG